MIGGGETPRVDEFSRLYPFGEHICDFFERLLTRLLSQGGNCARILAVRGFIVDQIFQTLLHSIGALKGML